MALGATTYTSVTWTTGDILTETKLDNMTANDQAYDSHAGNGYLSNNNVGFWCKDSGGTNRLIAVLDTNDDLLIGETNVDHIVLQPGSAEHVKYQTIIQDGAGSNSFVNELVTIKGWGYITGDGASGTLTKAVSFGITFADLEHVMLVSIGDLLNSDPSVITDFDSQSFSINYEAYNPTNTGFTAAVVTRSIDGSAPGALVNNNRYGFAWEATGQI